MCLYKNRKPVKKNDDNWHQSSLTPVKIDNKESAAYRTVEDLIHAINDDSMLNIAVSGQYCSGKSSVLKTLVSDDKSGNKFLNISLATLKANNEKAKGEGGDIQDDNTLIKDECQENKIENEESEKLSRRIEYSILQQLIYKEKFKTLPFSHFKKIIHLSKYKVVAVALMTMLFFLSFIVAYYQSVLGIDYLKSKWMFLANHEHQIFFIALSIMFLVVAYALVQVIYLLGRVRIHNVKFGATEICLDSNESLFNKYLSEIIYFFQCTDYNVVILEDLDRFDHPEIFLKLRELNYLLNQSKIVGRPIKFVYAVRDDLFYENLRTKFFDYITTVIPVVTRFNSKDKLKQELGGDNCKMSDSSLRTIAFHITDMRTLHNIVNEYKQYYESIKRNFSDSLKFDSAKLLALITFKNYYPSHFDDLQNGMGNVYEALSSKNKNECRHSISEKLDAEIELELKEINNHPNKERLLIEKYISETKRYLQRKGVAPETNIILDGEVVGIDELSKNQPLFSKLIKENQICIQIIDYAGRTTKKNIPFPFAEIENKVDGNNSYFDNYSMLITEYDKHSQNKRFLEANKRELVKLSVHEIIAKYPFVVEKFFSVEKITEMAFDFIQNGLIDENYIDYISYCYSGLLNFEEYMLCKEIKMRNNVDWDSVIVNFDTFIEELPDSVFAASSIYNVCLLDYLYKNSSKSNIQEKYNIFLNNLSDNVPCEFLIHYCENGECFNDVYSECIKIKGDEIWNKLVADNNIVLIKKWLICHSADFVYLSYEQRNWIQNNFSIIESIYDQLSQNMQKAVTSGLKYKILIESKSEMLDHVIKAESYEINEDNMPIIVLHKDAYENIENLNEDEMLPAMKLKCVAVSWHNVNECFITENFDSDLLRDFVSANIDNLESVSESNDDLNALFRWLLASENFGDKVYDSLCKKYKRAIDFTNDELLKLKDSQLKSLIKHDVLSYDTKIFKILYNKSNDVAICYIHKYKRTGFKELLESVDLSSEFVNELLNDKRIDEKRARCILESIKKDIDLTSASASKICYLLGIKYSNCNFKVIIKALQKCSKDYLVNQINATCNILDSISPNNNQISELLNALPDEYKKLTKDVSSTSLPNTSYNINLALILKELGYLTKYNPDKNGKKIRVYLK